MERQSEHKSGLGLFLAGVTVGVIMTVGVGSEEGRRLADRLGEVLKDLTRTLNEENTTRPPHRPHLPPPPRPTITQP